MSAQPLTGYNTDIVEVCKDRTKIGKVLVRSTWDIVAISVMAFGSMEGAPFLHTTPGPAFD